MNDDDLIDRVEAERFACPYVLPPRGPKGEPRPCGARVGEHCRNPVTGGVLTRHAAHRPRLLLAGRAAGSTVPGTRRA